MKRFVIACFCLEVKIIAVKMKFPKEPLGPASECFVLSPNSNKKYFDKKKFLCPEEFNGMIRNSYFMPMRIRNYVYSSEIDTGIR